MHADSAGRRTSGICSQYLVSVICRAYALNRFSNHSHQTQIFPPYILYPHNAIDNKKSINHQKPTAACSIDIINDYCKLIIKNHEKYKHSLITTKTTPTIRLPPLKKKINGQ